MKFILQRFKSKTYWLSILVAASGQLPLAADYMGDYYGPVSILIAVLIAAMREKTNKSIKDK